MIINSHCVFIPQQVMSIKVIGLNTQGVKLIKLDAHDKVAGVARVVSEEEEDE